MAGSQIIPVRGLGSVGVIRDVDPYDLPPSAWSKAKNVVFQNGAAHRGPAFRTVASSLGAAAPVFMMGIYQLTGYDQFLYANSDGSLYIRTGGVDTDVSEAGHVDTVNTNYQTTGCILGEVVYVNSPGMIPRYKRPGDADFLLLSAAGWDADWKAKALRPFGDYLVALNITKDEDEFPTTVKWSDIALIGQPPASWDATSPTTTAGETTLTDLTGPLIDGLMLRDAFMLYSRSEVVTMRFVGGRFIMDFRAAFKDAGVIAPNCIVEAQGKHFVFGTNDIYTHDGLNKQSLVEGSNRDFIFRTLDSDAAHLCFAMHNQRASEVWFCYRSVDGEAKWQGTSHCNMAFVFNYASGTGSYVDLPNAVASGIANAAPVTTWTSLVGTAWQNWGGFWASSATKNVRYPLMLGAPFAGTPALTGSRIWALDPHSGPRSTLSLPVDTETVADAILERLGIDLDEMGAGLSLFKLVRRIYPQVKYSGGSLYVRAGGHKFPGSVATFSSSKGFDPSTKYKVDIRNGGRYLSLQYLQEGVGDFTITGHDIEVVGIGRK